jgi:hypothetical protein
MPFHIEAMAASQVLQHEREGGIAEDKGTPVKAFDGVH